MLKKLLHKNIVNGKKTLALLIDPDKHNDKSLVELLSLAGNRDVPHIILIGGSIVFNGIDKTVEIVKKYTSKPVYLFPGSALQVSDNADGILFLSLISGRNPEFLIGNHILAAPKLKKSGIDILPVGYILVNSGVDTSVSYMSNTTPIPYGKNDIAAATAIAGEMLGLQAIYLEAGSGAKKHVSTDMIKIVKSNINIPLIVGGGIKNKKQLDEVLNAGADMAVVGTAVENNSEILEDFIHFLE
jgi:putative glycerol-1-phosphate prenyltransferase